MTRGWMPFYVGDFLADTMHLSAIETGIYIRLIMHCWQHGSIPLDDRQLAIISRCDPRLWWKYKETVLQFFDSVDASTAQHRRVTSELHRYEKLSNKRKAAAEQMLKKKEANAAFSRARALPPPLQDSPNGESITDLGLRKPKSRLVSKNQPDRAGFENFWKAYPKRKGANPKEPARQAFAAALKAGATAEEITAGAERYRKDPSTKVGTEFVARALTWLHQKRWTDYPETNLEAKPNGGGFYAKPESPQLEAWDAHRKATTGKSAPRDAAGGWHFPTEWPPGYAAAKLKAELMAGLE